MSTITILSAEARMQTQKDHEQRCIYRTMRSTWSSVTWSLRRS
jgi:hypothetical protein